MTKYFSQDTPLAGLERMMMSVPGFQKRGGGMMVLCRFHYKKEDVDCTYCRSYMRHTCQESVCPYIPERLEAGTIGYQELAERCLRMAGHQKLWKRASSLSKGNTLPLALEPAHRHRLSKWPEAGTASICPQKLAAVYLLSSRIGLWRRVLPHISHGRIDFSSVSLRGIDPRDYPVYRAAKGLYCGKLLITSAELADEEQVSSEAFGDILNAMLIARYGKTIIAGLMFLIIGGLAFISHYYTLNGIKSKTVGDGQHGTARWATKQEIRQTYAHIPFEPELWRQGKNLPDQQGLILGCEGPKGHVTAVVDTDDIHALVTAASGAGKTAFFLYPNIEYALATGMSFLCTDTKGDLFRNYAGIARECYGYQTAILDLRNPTRSDGNNLLHLINKYMDIYKAEPDNLAAKAKAEKYAKILAKTLINTSGGDSAQYGQNAFFYDSAEGLLTAMFLLVAEYLPTEDEEGNPVEKRHIVSVFKLVQELLAPSRVKGKNQFQLLLDKLPPNHKAKWFAGSALNTAEQAMASVLSTVLSRLNAFLDSEMEQILCFDTAVDAEKFCNEKSAIFVVLPEEDTTKYFMVSLIIQNLYREILTVADENGGRLKNRVVFFADELGSCPPIQSLELMFSASRSRGLMLVPIVQSITGQLQKNYGKEGSEIIVDNCQVNIFGGFAPASQTAEELSKALGSRTVMSGSISRGKNDPSQSLQMMERPLMTPDELKSMPKGSFIVAKTGVHPMRVRLRLFLDWGIRFGEPYEVPEKAQRPVAYADKQELEEAIIRRHYASSIEDEENQVDQGAAAAGGLSQGMRPEANRRKPALRP